MYEKRIGSIATNVSGLATKRLAGKMALPSQMFADCKGQLNYASRKIGSLLCQTFAGYEI
jgi:hypothetical protein